MAYRNFKMADLKAKFGIQEVGTDLFKVSAIKPIEPSLNLINKLADAPFITLSTEKAVSEQLIAHLQVCLSNLVRVQ